MRTDLVEELRNGYDNEPESLPREAERMASVMQKPQMNWKSFKFTQIRFMTFVGCPYGKRFMRYLRKSA
jgi:hypothetical protein